VLTLPWYLQALINQACIAIIYCVLTFILYIDNILPFLINAGVDTSLLIAFVVVSVTMGKPLSLFDCQAIGAVNNPVSALQFTNRVLTTVTTAGGDSSMSNWINSSTTNCLEMKAVWGLSISLW
jgi:hypothetical protein